MPELIGTVKIECLFGDGMRVLHVERPIGSAAAPRVIGPSPKRISPGANAGRRTAEVDVENRSDHTIFISSHFPFFEVNRRLVFDRAVAWGMHLDIPAGDSIGWRPGETHRVRLVAFGGRGVVVGFNRLTEGATGAEGVGEGLERVRRAGYGHRATGDGHRDNADGR